MFKNCKSQWSSMANELSYAKSLKVIKSAPASFIPPNSSRVDIFPRILYAFRKMTGGQMP